MRFRDLLICILLLIIIVGLWFWIDERKRSRALERAVNRLTSDLNELRRGYLDLLQRHLILDKKTPPDIVEELERLKDQVVNLGKDVHLELKSVIELVEDGKYSKAIKDLAKIIENVLKEKVKNDGSFTKKPILANLLEHAKKCLWIKPNEHAYGELIREIRNKEAHELNVQLDPHNVGLAIFSGIQIIYTLSSSTAQQNGQVHPKTEIIHL